MKSGESPENLFNQSKEIYELKYIYSRSISFISLLTISRYQRPGYIIYTTLRSSLWMSNLSTGKTAVRREFGGRKRGANNKKIKGGSLPCFCGSHKPFGLRALFALCIFIILLSSIHKSIFLHQKPIPIAAFKYGIFQQPA